MKFKLILTLNLPTAVLGLTRRPDGSAFYAACLDGRIYEVDADAKKFEPFADGHASYASGCALLPEAKVLISGGYDGCLLWHNVAERRVTQRVRAHDFWSWQLALAPEGARIASVSGQFLVGTDRYEPAAATTPTVCVYDTATGKRVAGFDLLPPVLSVAFSPDGRHLAAANMMGTVRVWDLQSGRRVAEIQTPDFTSWGIIKSPHYLGGIYGLAFAPDGATLLGCGMGPMTDPMAGNGKMTWQRWSWRDNPPARVMQIPDEQRGAGLMETLVFAPDGQSFLMGGRQAQGTWNVALFATNDGRLLASIDTKSRVTRALFAEDGRRLYLAAAVGQGPRKDGQWPDFGRLHVLELEA